MARLVATTLLLTFPSLAAGTQAAEPSRGPWHTDEKIRTSRNFQIDEHESQVDSGKGGGSRIFAGRHLMPNGVVGIGMFGQKADKGPHSAATDRDLSLPKQRKAAVGFSLRF